MINRCHFDESRSVILSTTVITPIGRHNIPTTDVILKVPESILVEIERNP